MKDEARVPGTREAEIYTAISRLMLRRLTRVAA